MNNRKIWIIAAVLVVVVVTSALFLLHQGKSSNTATLDSFAQCLVGKGATMYGAYWCPHCQAEKALFGASFRYVGYVECTQDVDKCTAAGIQAFPTWKYPDGTTYVGTQSLEQLAAESGCALPSGY